MLSEAERARKRGKLIQVRTDDVAPEDLPPPFDTSHAPLLNDRKSIYGALAKLGLLDIKIAATSDPLPLFSQQKRSPLSTLSQHKRATIALAALLVAAVLAGFVLFKKQTAPGYRTASQQTEGAAKVVNQFFDALNSGFADSSVFDSELRLGRRGNRTRVEAVTDVDCDFVDKQGNITSSNFPIEIEAAPNSQNTKSYLITGIWHSAFGQDGPVASAGA